MSHSEHKKCSSTHKQSHGYDTIAIEESLRTLERAVHDVCRPKYHERSSLISVIADDFCDALLEQHILVDARLTSRVLGRHGAARPVAKLKEKTEQRARSMRIARTNVSLALCQRGCAWA
jgi:hypothetical protein